MLYTRTKKTKATNYNDILKREATKYFQTGADDSYKNIQELKTIQKEHRKCITYNTDKDHRTYISSNYYLDYINMLHPNHWVVLQSQLKTPDKVQIQLT